MGPITTAGTLGLPGVGAPAAKQEGTEGGGGTVGREALSCTDPFPGQNELIMDLDFKNKLHADHSFVSHAMNYRLHPCRIQTAGRLRLLHLGKCVGVLDCLLCLENSHVLVLPATPKGKSLMDYLTTLG